MKVLFLTKRRMGSGGCLGDFSSGLYNSARFVVEMLERVGIRARLRDVVDANSIDREVHHYRPDVVVIEAFWVTPRKFDELLAIYPFVKWIVRNHSKVPFLAQEGVAMEWSLAYLKRFITVACNSRQATRDLQVVAEASGAPAKMVSYLPNYYPPGSVAWPGKGQRRREVNIGCFGAIRPLKNQMVQAIAAIGFAQKERLRLSFHVNAERVEGGGEPILKGLRALFATGGHKLVEHGWLSYTDFLYLVGGMDLNMQVSFSETFNIVSADSVTAGIPIVVSPEVEWLGGYAKTNPNDAEEVADKLREVYHDPLMELRLRRQQFDLSQFSSAARRVWLEEFEGYCPRPEGDLF